MKTETIWASRKEENEWRRKNGKHILLTQTEITQWERSAHRRPHMTCIDREADPEVYHFKSYGGGFGNQFCATLDSRSTINLRPLHELHRPIIDSNGVAFKPIEELAKQFLLIQGQKGKDYTPDHLSFTPEHEEYKLFWRGWRIDPSADIVFSAEVNFMGYTKLDIEGVYGRSSGDPFAFLVDILRPLEYLRQWHFDVYGLIEKGIALTAGVEHNTVSYSVIPDEVMKARSKELGML